MPFLGIDQVDVIREVAPAAWIAYRLDPAHIGPQEARDRSLVPSGFEASARVLHPAGRRTAEGARLVRWSSVALWSGQALHPESEFYRIAGLPDAANPVHRPWDDEPLEGPLTSEDCATLSRVLAGFTSTADHCWFALWDLHHFLWNYRFGYRRHDHHGRPGEQKRGYRTSPIKELDSVQRLTLPGDDFVLLLGRLMAVNSFGSLKQTPDVWWPENRAWFVSFAVRVHSTYVAGSADAIEAVLRSPDLEALLIKQSPSQLK